jgi:ribosomal-protein-alanine N-acetyltransferase
MRTARSARSSRPAHIRRSRPADLDALSDLESRVFATDRMSRRSLRRLLASPSAVVLVAQAGAAKTGAVKTGAVKTGAVKAGVSKTGAVKTGAAKAGAALAGVVVVLFRANSRIARLYSIAVAPAHSGRGIASSLLAAAERAARSRRCRSLRLEVHEKNRSAIRLYRKAGFHQFGRHHAYYRDRGHALRFVKELGSS